MIEEQSNDVIDLSENIRTLANELMAQVPVRLAEIHQMRARVIRDWLLILEDRGEITDPKKTQIMSAPVQFLIPPVIINNKVLIKVLRGSIQGQGYWLLIDQLNSEKALA